MFILTPSFFLFRWIMETPTTVQLEVSDTDRSKFFVRHVNINWNLICLFSLLFFLQVKKTGQAVPKQMSVVLSGWPGEFFFINLIWSRWWHDPLNWLCLLWADGFSKSAYMCLNTSIISFDTHTGSLIYMGFIILTGLRYQPRFWQRVLALWL